VVPCSLWRHAQTLGGALLLCSVACGRVGYEPNAADSGADADTGIVEAGMDSAPDTAVEVGVDTGVPDAPDPDTGADGAMCPETPCRLVPPQCGCGVDEACMYEGGPVCRPAGDGAAGTACADHAACAVGLGCTRGSSAEGVCSPFCITNADCAGGSVCIRAAGLPDSIGVCSVRCDPLANTGCPAGLGCHAVGGLQVEDGALALITSCGPATGPATGAACTIFCEPRNLCIGDICEEICLFPGGACPAPTSCGRLTPRAVLWGIEYGSCF